MNARRGRAIWIGPCSLTVILPKDRTRGTHIKPRDELELVCIGRIVIQKPRATSSLLGAVGNALPSRWVEVSDLVEIVSPGDVARVIVYIASALALSLSIFLPIGLVLGESPQGMVGPAATLTAGIVTLLASVKRRRTE